MSRSIWKVPHIPILFFSNFFVNKKKIYIWNRSVIISNYFINRKFKVHNGIWLLSFMVKTAMVNHKLGEFSFTKCFIKIHKKKKKKKIKKK